MGFYLKVRRDWRFLRLLWKKYYKHKHKATENERKLSKDDASRNRKEQKQMESMKNELANVYYTSSGNSNREFDSGSQNTIKVRKLLEDNKNHIEWDGNK